MKSDPDRSVMVAADAVPPSPVLKAEHAPSAQQVRLAANLRHHLSIFSKHKRVIIVSFVLLSFLFGGLAFVYHKWLYTPKFEARSSIMVKFGWENFYPDPSLGKRQNFAISQNEMLGAEMSILDGRELKEKVVSAMTPEGIFPQLAKEKITGMSKQDVALLLLDKYLKIKSSYGSIIHVTFEGATPQICASVVNQFVNDYIDKRSEIYKDPKMTLFLQNKAEYYRQKLAQSLANMKAFSDRTQIYDFNNQRNTLLTQRASLSVELNKMSNEMKGLQETTAELQKELKAIPKSTDMAAGVVGQGDSPEAKLLALRMQEFQLRQKYKDNSPVIANIRAQIAYEQKLLKKNAQNPNVASANPVYQDIQKQIIDNKAKLSEMSVVYTGTQAQLGRINDELKAFEADENQYRTLEAAVASDRQVYNNYRQKVEEANVYNELGRDKMTSVSVIEPASPPIAPINPPKPLPLLFGAAIVFALACSVGIAYALETYMQVMNTGIRAEMRVDLSVLSEYQVAKEKESQALPEKEPEKPLDPPAPRQQTR